MTTQAILDHLRAGGSINTSDTYAEDYDTFKLIDGKLHRGNARNGYKPEGFWRSPEQFAWAASRYLTDSAIHLQ